MNHDYECAVKKVTAQPTLSITGRTRVANLSATIGEFLPEVWQYITAQGATPAGPPFTRYHEIGAEEVVLEAGLPVPPGIQGKGRIKAGTLPGGEVVSTVHVGPYHSLPDAGAALTAWAKAHGRAAAGPNWELYVTDPGVEPDPTRWKTEVVQPLTPRS